MFCSTWILAYIIRLHISYHIQHLAISCVPTVHSAVICLEVIISVTYIRVTDMRVISCLPLCILLNTWLVYFIHRNTFYSINLFQKTNAKGDTHERNEPDILSLFRSL